MFTPKELNMETEKTQLPTIAELWRELENLLTIEFDNGDTILKDGRVHIAKVYQEKNIPLLRAQLFERCACVPDAGGQHTRFHVDDLMPKLVINSVDRIRHESAHTAREMAAAYAFLVWQIEQSEKESRTNTLADLECTNQSES